MNEETKQLLKEIKAYRDEMVAHNYPHQEISDIITRWEMKDVAPLNMNEFIKLAAGDREKMETVSHVSSLVALQYLFLSDLEII